MRTMRNVIDSRDKEIKRLDNLYNADIHTDKVTEE